MPQPNRRTPRTQRTQLDRALSKLGLCSRGEAARRIREGRVRVNGSVAASPEQWVDLETDRIAVAPGGTDGDEGSAKRFAPSGGPRRYLALHKPPGYVSTRSDELGRKTVYDLLPPELRGGWVFPVGRLDKDSEGLLLMTDDGAWADRLTDPRFHIEKTYRVKLDGRPRAAELDALRGGVVLAGKKTLPAVIEEEGGGWYRVILREGRNRQIRKMFHGAGYKVKRLIRVAIGELRLGDLQPGEARRLEKKWVESLRGDAP